MLLTTPVYAHQNDIQVIMDTYKWFNQISGDNKIPISAKEDAEHFSGDAKMITNGKLVCEGIAAHLAHFHELNTHFSSMQINLDELDWRQADDRIYLTYTIAAKNHQQQPIKIYVMGYMTIKNQRITLFNEIVHKEMI